MNFYKKLKELRQKKGVTQEALAQHLDISAQAVSKWERDEGYPDISLLPRIAMYFDTSIDELLGLGEEKIRADIEEWKEQSKKLFFKGNIDANYDIWSEAYKKYPNNLDVIENYMIAVWYVFLENRKKELAEKVIELGKEILDRSTNTSQRESAFQILTYTYSDIGDYENAKKYAEMGGTIYTSRMELMKAALKGEEQIKHFQEMLNTFTEELADAARMLAEFDKEYSTEEKIEIFKFALDLFLTVYKEDTSGFHYTRMSQIASDIARHYASLKDRERTLKYLADAAEYSKTYDKYVLKLEKGEAYKFKSLMLNRCSDAKIISKNHMDNDCACRLRSFGYKCYDFLRDDPEFQRIKEELEKNAK